ncbi:hypothetical protein [Stenotrophomonas sp. SAU14A_NAIMI4_8]|uniref:hypothetical protein n=1 Tax=Stenotrophomonas sp. SAU14A_NAIMI4_8 TaxID=2072409 RepID=UPI000D53EB5A|nr:hypothetical protein [Stenotrophomonas sp. SAU14A_NAIMI4_8]AWH32251.1 hypothetical protein C1930_04910 [Stenotrophomonas sp. SAU14A_NAIMI4_8]
MPEPAAPPIHLQIAFLCGQSDPARCALSPAQLQFGQALLAPGRRLHPCNFPYDAQTAPFRRVPLLSASWHNSRQYLRSRQPAFARRHAAAVTDLLLAAPHTLLLAGSCGLELLANLQLPAALSQRFSVLAYGPVARHAPAAARLQVLVGRQDWISRAGWRGARQWVRSGHMDYLQQAPVLTQAHAMIARIEQALP